MVPFQRVLPALLHHLLHLGHVCIRILAVLLVEVLRVDDLAVDLRVQLDGVVQIFASRIDQELRMNCVTARHVVHFSLQVLLRNHLVEWTVRHRERARLHR